MGVTRKQSTSNFPKNKHFLPPGIHTHVCVSGRKKCSFFEKFGVLGFHVTPVLRFALLPYYRDTTILKKKTKVNLSKTITKTFCRCEILTWTHFMLLVSFYTPWRISNVFRVYRKRLVVCNGLITIYRKNYAAKQKSNKTL